MNAGKASAFKSLTVAGELRIYFSVFSDHRGPESPGPGVPEVTLCQLMTASDVSSQLLVQLP